MGEGLNFVDDGGVFGVMASFRQEDVDGFTRGALFHEGADCADGALVQWGGWAACGYREPCRSPEGESRLCLFGFMLGQFCPCLGRCEGLKLIAAAGDVGSQVTAVCFPCSIEGEQTPSGEKEESLKCFPSGGGDKLIDELCQGVGPRSAGAPRHMPQKWSWVLENFEELWAGDWCRF